MWKHNVEQGRPQMTIRRMLFAFWIPKATNTHSQFVIHIAFPLQQWFHESVSVVRYMYAIYVCVYIYKCVCVCVYIYIYIYMCVWGGTQKFPELLKKIIKIFVQV